MPASVDPIPYYMLMLDRVRQRADDFDVLHFHIDQFQFPLFRPIADRTVTTLHGRQDLPDLLAALSRLRRHAAGFDLQRSAPPGAERQLRGNRLSRPAGQPASPPAGPRGDYVAFLGRISPEKRPDRAIAIARALGIPLKIAAKVDRADEAYFRTTIEPLLDGPGVEFIGEINEHQKTQFLGDARALLFPVDWPEPFGLSMIEAMACGTPVLAFRCGSVPEIIDEGITGAIVETHGRGDRGAASRHGARPKKGAAAFRASLFRHTDGKGLRRRLSFAARVVEIRRRPEAGTPGHGWGTARKRSF